MAIAPANDSRNLQRDTDATDRPIDQFTRELCGLTADEIRIIEEAIR